ncbi:hypothetical protein [Metallosphaera javensis (ex Sakai et al. 2022)]|uniref:hypothetical protein n=1 Tax=Metallosphaera javensis (ex Sakai et al. 2022) TaxID=2775498 RepID=UPI002584DD1D
MANSNSFLYLGIILAIIGLIVLVAGTTTVTYPSEYFDVNGMNLTTGTTANYFINFFGLAIFLFGIGSLLSHAELRRRSRK